MLRKSNVFYPSELAVSKNYLYKQYRVEYKRAILSLLEKQPNAQLLDLGCKDGVFTKELMLEVGIDKAWGLDMLPFHQEGVLEILGDLNLPLPINNSLMDIVCASQIIEHISNTDRFLREIHRVLKPNGYLIVSTNNLASWHNIFYLMLGLQPPTCMVSDEMDLIKSDGPGHRRIFTFSALSRLIEFHGFKIEKTVGTSYYPLPTCLARLMCKLDRGHSVCINIKARKV